MLTKRTLGALALNAPCCGRGVVRGTRLQEPRRATGVGHLELADAAAAGEHAHGLQPATLRPSTIEAHPHRLPGDVRRDAPAHDDPLADERKRRAAADLLQREPDQPGDRAVTTGAGGEGGASTGVDILGARATAGAGAESRWRAARSGPRRLAASAIAPISSSEPAISAITCQERPALEAAEAIELFSECAAIHGYSEPVIR